MPYYSSLVTSGNPKSSEDGFSLCEMDKLKAVTLELGVCSRNGNQSINQSIDQSINPSLTHSLTHSHTHSHCLHTKLV